MKGEPALKYRYLARHIEHPQFDKLKQIADIEVNGNYPYHYFVEDIPRFFSSSQIDDICAEALVAQKNGSDIAAKIAQQIDEIALARMNIKKCKATSLDVSAFKIKDVD